MKIRVSVNGYGTIGKRVADAVLMQPDMELVGVSKRAPDYEAKIATSRGIRVFVEKEAIDSFRSAGIEVSGTREDMIRASDVVIDATPDGVGERNKELYVKLGRPAIFQGGEEPHVAEASFSALCNYDDVQGKKYVRVVSCNTTGMLRVLCSLRKVLRIRKARVTLIRRAADPREVKKGPINAVMLNPVKLPSHHADDVKTVLGNVDILTSAYVVPTTLMHVHSMMLEIEGSAATRDVIEALESSPRIVGVSGASGISSTAEIIEAFRDLGRKRNDVPEVVLFEDSVYAMGNELLLSYAVHQESIVVPENIDAIRAIFGLMRADDSISLTDRTLGILRGRVL
ncbi:MAG: type II glyceraldehyde-3-phosphate dehydrogenase [Nitrososphaeria archaeon]